MKSVSVIRIPAVMNASALQVLLAVLTGWLDRQEREVLRYLVEENRVLRQQLRGRRLQLTDSDRRRPAVRAYRLGRRRLREIATIVTPEMRSWCITCRLGPQPPRKEVASGRGRDSARSRTWVTA